MQYTGQGNMNFGQGKVSEKSGNFLRVGTLIIQFSFCLSISTNVHLNYRICNSTESPERSRS